MDFNELGELGYNYRQACEQRDDFVGKLLSLISVVAEQNSYVYMVDNPLSEDSFKLFGCKILISSTPYSSELTKPKILNKTEFTWHRGEDDKITFFSLYINEYGEVYSIEDNAMKRIPDVIENMERNIFYVKQKILVPLAEAFIKVLDN
ncbi:hypothetical protein AYI84_04605 [Shewanella algae]|uniref:hypothetical protein n=1 Tax=Shewanella algae TaxID=38313 RepID=UPI0011825AEF|nr:hypothetical protein [Shewanella algae]MBO2568612.1 hypothetical protein [Shewanella algae]TVL05276.1 hypothetical protein AYI84_04605 [Shewanella algae]